MSADALSAFWGVVMASVNVGIAIIAFRIALRQENTTVFMRIVFGSMIGRSAFTLFAIWYGLRVWHFETIPFVLTLLFFYLAAMTGELVALHRRQLALSRTFFAEQRMKTDSKTEQRNEQ